MIKYRLLLPAKQNCVKLLKKYALMFHFFLKVHILCYNGH